MVRNFYEELKEENFIKITYGIFNKMDDEQYISFLEKKFKEPFSVEDFKYYDFVLSDKEKFLIKMHNKEFLKNVKTLNELILIKEEEFFDFQNLIRECIGKKAVELPNPKEHPRIKEMKRKARYRDKVKAKQAAKSKDGISLFTSLVSICCMGLGITPLNIGEMSYIALESILRKYQEKEKYQLDIDSLLAGADSKKIKPKYWIRNFEE